MKKYDGDFSVLGMLIGIPIGGLFGNVMMGLGLGIVFGIAMDWFANLWENYH